MESLTPLRSHEQLPSGYRFEDPGNVTSAEAVAMYRRAGMEYEVEDDYLDVGRPEVFAKYGVQAMDVAVRADDGTLAGYGSVVYRGSQGELSDFAVDPSHQGKGVGRSILLERLRIAELAGIDSLYVAEMLPTNNLAPLYLECGFQQVGDAEYARGPNAAPLGVDPVHDTVPTA